MACFDFIRGVGGGFAEGASSPLGGVGGAICGLGRLIGRFLRRALGFVFGDDFLVFLQGFAFGGVGWVFFGGFGGGFGAVQVGAGFFFDGADLWGVWDIRLWILWREGGGGGRGWGE